jgi:hypothetical protein
MKNYDAYWRVSSLEQQAQRANANDRDASYVQQPLTTVLRSFVHVRDCNLRIV